MKRRIKLGKFHFLTGIAVMVLLVISAGCGSQKTTGASDGTKSDAKPIQIRVSLEGIKSYEKWADKFEELAEKELPGKVDIVLYKGGQLGDQKQAYEQVNLGTLEMAIGASIQTTYEPKYEVLEFPYIFRDRAHMTKVVTGPIAKELNDSLIKSKGMRTVTIFDAGFRQVANNIRPIVKPEDMKGIKIRTPKSPFRMEIFQAMGAAPTPTSYSDLFLSLQQKIVEGLELPLYDIFVDSFYEVQTYLSLTNHVYTPSYAVVKEQWWQSLPSEVRTGLQKAADDAAAYTRESNLKAEEEYTQKLKEKGMKVNEIDTEAFRELMKQTVWKKYQDKMGDLIKRVEETK